MKKKKKKKDTTELDDEIKWNCHRVGLALSN